MKLPLVFVWILLVAMLDSAHSIGRSGSPKQTNAQDLAANSPTCNHAPSKADCEVGDMVLFNGLLCFSGQRIESCNFVQQSQDATGRFWRSPWRIGKDVENSFSRDMALGVILYGLATNDRQALTRFERFIEENDGLLCHDGTDSRCIARIGTEFMLARVLRNEEDRFGLCGALLIAHALLAPVGYQLHLVAVQALIARELGFPKTQELVGRILAWRDAQNPFFQMLANRQKEAIEIAAAQMSFGAIKKTQWSLERDSAEEAYKTSMGWEFVFLTDLLQKQAALTFPRL